MPSLQREITPISSGHARRKPRVLQEEGAGDVRGVSVKSGGWADIIR